VVLFTALKFIAEEFILPNILKHFHSKEQDETTEEPITDISTVELEEGSKTSEVAEKSMVDKYVPFSFKDPKIAFLYFQGVVALVTFIIACRSIDRNRTTWNQYQDLYGLVLNSSTLTFFISCMLFYSTPPKEPPQKDITTTATTAVTTTTSDASDLVNLETARKVFNKAKTFSIVSIVLISCTLIPAFITHILPGFIVYCWILLLFNLFFYALNTLYMHCVTVVDPVDKKRRFVDNSREKKIYLLIKEVTFRLYCILVFQSFFNYMYLFYQIHESPMSNDQYTGVLEKEYELRTQTACLFEHMASSAGNVLVFFNWL
jgi:hypothetical protein